MDDVVLKGNGLFTGAFTVCVLLLLPFQELGITSTHAVLAFLLVLLQIFCCCWIDIPPLDLVAKQMWEFLLWEEIQDPSCVISITLETLVSSEICTNKTHFVHIEYLTEICKLQSSVHRLVSLFLS